MRATSCLHLDNQVVFPVLHLVETVPPPVLEDQAPGFEPWHAREDHGVCLGRLSRSGLVDPELAVQAVTAPLLGVRSAHREP